MTDTLMTVTGSRFENLVTSLDDIVYKANELRLYSYEIAHCMVFRRRLQPGVDNVPPGIQVSITELDQTRKCIEQARHQIEKKLQDVFTTANRELAMLGELNRWLEEM